MGTPLPDIADQCDHFDGLGTRLAPDHIAAGRWRNAGELLVDHIRDKPGKDAQSDVTSMPECRTMSRIAVGFLGARAALGTHWQVTALGRAATMTDLLCSAACSPGGWVDLTRVTALAALARAPGGTLRMPRLCRLEGPCQQPSGPSRSPHCSADRRRHQRTAPER